MISILDVWLPVQEVQLDHGWCQPSQLGGAPPCHEFHPPQWPMPHHSLHLWQTTTPNIKSSPTPQVTTVPLMPMWIRRKITLSGVRQHTPMLTLWASLPKSHGACSEVNVAPKCPHCTMVRSTSSKNASCIQRNCNSHPISDKDWMGPAISQMTIQNMGTSNWHLTPSTGPFLADNSPQSLYKKFGNTFLTPGPYETTIYTTTKAKSASPTIVRLCRQCTKPAINYQ